MNIRHSSGRSLRGWVLALVVSALAFGAAAGTAGAVAVEAGCTATAGPSTSDVQQTQFTVDWVDNCTDETGFFMDVKTVDGNFGDLDQRTNPRSAVRNATSKAIADLTCNTEYFFRIVAFHEAGPNISFSLVGSGNQTTAACGDEPPSNGTPCGPAAPAVAAAYMFDLGMRPVSGQFKEIMKLVAHETGAGGSLAARDRCDNDFADYVQAVEDFVQDYLDSLP